MKTTCTETKQTVILFFSYAGIGHVTRSNAHKDKSYSACDWSPAAWQASTPSTEGMYFSSSCGERQGAVPHSASGGTLLGLDKGGGGGQ